jgi:hypothetical protein
MYTTYYGSIVNGNNNGGYGAAGTNRFVGNAMSYMWNSEASFTGEPCRESSCLQSHMFPHSQVSHAEAFPLPLQHSFAAAVVVAEHVIIIDPFVPVSPPPPPPFLINPSTAPV